MFKHVANPMVVIACLLAVIPGVTAATNLIRNGGFEEGPGNYPGVGKYWETNDAQPHAAIDVLDPDIKHSGGFSQWLKANPQWDLGAVRQITPYNSVTPGKTYRISAWIKTANVANPAGWYVFGAWWFNNDAYISDSKMPRPDVNNYDWRLITWTAVAPAGANRVGAFLSRHTDGDAWYDDISITEVIPGQPVIAFDPPSFSHQLRKCSRLSDDLLTIRNTGGGQLNFSITTSAAWLAVNPAAGSSLGDPVDCTVSYAAESLLVGTHNATITIADSAAANSPQIVPVTLTVTAPGDFDLDGDVDQEDFGRFQGCYSGEGVSQGDPACAEARFDADPDVDLEDFIIWQTYVSGPNNPANPSCPVN